MSPHQLKSDLRRVALAARDSVAAEARIEASLEIAAIGAREIAVRPGETVAGFWPIRSEVDVRPLMFALRERGARLCLPVVIDATAIVFRELVCGAALVGTGFGTAGPGPEAAELDPALILAPLAAFDGAGRRIGYGGGYYDRAVAVLRARAGRENAAGPRLIGVAFAAQEVDRVPAEAHDAVLDAVLTERGLRRMPESGPRAQPARRRAGP